MEINVAVNERGVDIVLELLESLYNAKIIGHWTYSLFDKKYYDKDVIDV